MTSWGELALICGGFTVGGLILWALLGLIT
jgi:hypothetical protein